MLRTILFILFITAITENVNSQTVRKEYSPVRISHHIQVDGMISDIEWSQVPIGSDFIQIEPENGLKSKFKTTFRFAYDDKAVYVAAFCHDPQHDSIMKELCPRDEINDVNADLLRIDLNPFNDGINSFVFVLTAAGIQADAKVSGSDEDWAWDAVWQGETTFSDSGWSVEFMIPYSAIRFPTTQVQDWGFNCGRHIRRTREWSTWNFIDKKIESVNAQAGLLKGISNIKSPVRLSAMPYASLYLDKPTQSLPMWYSNFGTDIKYGLNKSFTLDMTLIPDFGQVQSDDLVLNLGPFEIKYEEKRSFFTEGTELFSKGGVFYSRRIGAIPRLYFAAWDSLKEGEGFVDNPVQTQLINATKVSGRTNTGLGIGFFNAITAQAKAIIIDSNKIKREIITQPLTNYNIMVFDQNLKHNSSITLINTNVLMKDYEADVSGLTFKINNKSNLFSVSGQGMVSQKYFSDKKDEFGSIYTVSGGKTGGKLKITGSHIVKTNTYDPNDLGYNASNNEMSDEIIITHSVFKPVWKIISMNNQLYFYRNSIYSPRSFAEFFINFDNFTTFKNYLSAGLSAGGRPGYENNYFEPRVDGWFYHIPPGYYISAWISPDYRKKVVFDVSSEYGRINKFDKTEFMLSVGPRLRLSNRAILTGRISNTIEKNDIGYVVNLPDSVNPFATRIYFGSRNVTNTTSTLTLNYVFTKKLSMGIRFRHYWFRADYFRFYELDSLSGNLKNTNYLASHDVNFNTWNIDLQLKWYFAPGSEIVVAWKNSAHDTETSVAENYFTNLKNVLDLPKNNVISVKILYYLDYLYLKRNKR